MRLDDDYIKRLGLLLGALIVCAVLADRSWPLSVWAAAFGVALIPFRVPRAPSLQQVNKQKKGQVAGAPARSSSAANPHVYVGVTTGAFNAKGASYAPPGNQQVFFARNDLLRHVFVLGQGGSGKTTRAVYPILGQMLAVGCGALVFAIKGTEAERVEQLARRNGRSVQRIEIGRLGLNLLRGVTPDTAAAYLRDAYQLTQAGSSDAVWPEAAQARVRAALHVLTAVAPDRYDLSALYRYVFVDAERDAWLAQAKEKLRPFRHPDTGALETACIPADLRRLAAALDFEQHEWAGIADETRRSVQFTLSSILSGFTDPEIADTFCSSTVAQADLRSIVQNGEVVVVHVPQDRYELTARIIYLWTKKRFQTLMSGRRADRTLNQDRIVVFCADEFQRFASTADSKFLGVEARDSGTMVVVATQSIPACDEVLGEKTTRAILANFSANLIFRIGDQDSLRWAASLVGHGVRDVRQSMTSGFSANRGQGPMGGNMSGGETHGRVREEVLDGSLFRNLRADECVALTWCGDRSLDDVLRVPQVQPWTW